MQSERLPLDQKNLLHVPSVKPETLTHDPIDPWRTTPGVCMQQHESFRLYSSLTKDCARKSLDALRIAELDLSTRVVGDCFFSHRLPE